MQLNEKAKRKKGKFIKESKKVKTKISKKKIK